MDIYVYSDESGVFDKVHNEYYIYGGIILLSKEEKSHISNRYLKAERIIKCKEHKDKTEEAKASKISNHSKGKLFRALNQVNKFSVVIHQEEIFNNIYKSKKTKQRYLDYAYKMSIKHAFINLINQNKIIKDDIENIYFNVDEHSTATDGIYELREALESELKTGTYNYTYSKFFEPLFPNVKSVNLNYCNSANNTLFRASDIIANRIYYLANAYSFDKILEIPNISYLMLPTADYQS